MDPTYVCVSSTTDERIAPIWNAATTPANSYILAHNAVPQSPLAGRSAAVVKFAKRARAKKKEKDRGQRKSLRSSKVIRPGALRRCSFRPTLPSRNTFRYFHFSQ